VMIRLLDSVTFISYFISRRKGALVPAATQKLGRQKNH
jgi:hypothetical protein